MYNSSIKKSEHKLFTIINHKNILTKYLDLN